MDRTSRKSARRGGRQGPPARIDDSRLRVFGLFVLCLKVALVPLAFDHAADASFVLPKALLSHGLAYVLAGVLVALVVLNGVGALLRSRVQISVLAYLGVSVLATAFAVNPNIALFGTHDRMLGLAAIADGVITFLATVELVRTRRGVIAVVGSVLTASSLILAYEVVQLSGHDPLSWSLDPSQRPISTVGQPTTLGQYLVTLSVVAYAFGLLTPRLRHWLRGGLVAYSAALLVAAGLTGTRSVVIGAAFAAVAFVAIVWVKRPGPRTRAFGLLGGVGAAGMLAAALLLTPIGGRLQSTVDAPTAVPTATAPTATAPTATAPTAEISNSSLVSQLEPSASLRISLYQMALEMLLERPILGYGPDNFAVGVPLYRPQPADIELRRTVTTSPHSFIASVATSTGTLGLITFAGILLLAAFELLRARFSPVGTVGALAVLAYMGAGITTVGAIETEMQFWLAIAAITGASVHANAQASGARESERTSVRVRTGSISQRVLVWSIVIVSVGIMSNGFTALGASRLAHQSVGMRTFSSMNVAIDLALKATRADSNRAEYWEQLALAYAGAARWSDASNAFEQAAGLEPYDIRFVTDAIQVQLLLFNRGDAQALLRAVALSDRVVRVDPGNPDAHLVRARVARIQKDIAQAARSIGRVLALQPNSTSEVLYLEAIDIYLADGRIEDATSAGRAGVANFARSVPLRVALAGALRKGGHLSEALLEIEAALAIRPDYPAALQLRDEIRSAP